MDELFQDFYAQDTTSAYAASNLLSISWQIQNKTYPKLLGDDENDAHEYFQFLTEALHASARLPSPNSIKVHDNSQETATGDPCNCIVHQTFYGSLQSSTTCQHCGAITTSIQPFLDLNLGLASIARKRAGKGGKGGQNQANLLTLQKCLDTEYIQPELCDYNCHSCSNSEKKGRRISTIKRLPNVLCIQFKVSPTHLFITVL
jgi:ubiquitin carboxyl-terminal hydrolase 22/27/51